MDENNMNEERPKINLFGINKENQVEPIVADISESTFDGNVYIRNIVANTKSKEDFMTFSKEEIDSANIAVLNKIMMRLQRLRPDEFAKMIKDELDGKDWFR